MGIAGTNTGKKQKQPDGFGGDAAATARRSHSRQMHVTFLVPFVSPLVSPRAKVGVS